MAGLGLLLLFYLGVVLMDLYPRHTLPYHKGQYIPRDITARVPFSILDEEELKKQLQDAQASTPATFRLNTGLLDELITTVEKIPTRLDAAKSREEVEPELRAQLGLKPPTDLREQVRSLQAERKELEDKLDQADEDAKANLQTKTKKIREQIDDLQNQIERLETQNADAFQAWRALAKPENRDKLESLLNEMRQKLRGSYFVLAKHAEQQQQRAARYVILQASESTTQTATISPKVVDLIGLDEQEKVDRRLGDVVQSFSPDYRRSLRTFLQKALLEKPIYNYDPAATAEDIAAAQRQIEDNPPTTKIPQGHVLAKRSVPVTVEDPAAEGLGAEEIKLLRAEHEKYLQMQRREYPWKMWLQPISKGLILLLLTLVLGAYVAAYHAQLIEQPGRGLAAVTTLLLMLGVTKFLNYGLHMNVHAVLLPVCMAGMILTIAFGQRFAMAVGAIFALIVLFQLGGSFGLLIILLGGLVAFVFQLEEIRTNSKILLSALVSAAVVFVLVWAQSIREGVYWTFIVNDSAMAVAAVIAAGLLVQALVPVIERVFVVATSNTLLGWCDASRPLLKRLSMESPGTYNHSLQLGAMCEAAAERIGGRGLLARVGAYYHDIGKINKPDYFTENQSGENKHKRLSPAMSLLIILGHVKDGLEMAREYNLPEVLLEFIATHHGTTLVQYFYHEAAKQSEAEGEPLPDESQFRYPGPKPRSREAAILMLADASESSVRAMTEPTPARIRSQVHKMVNLRLEDGQLDECLLTLREVHDIEESLIKSLCGMYHSRIAYPKKEDKPKEKDREKPRETGEQKPDAQPADESAAETSSPEPSEETTTREASDQSDLTVEVKPDEQAPLPGEAAPARPTPPSEEPPHPEPTEPRDADEQNDDEDRASEAFGAYFRKR
jgi:putative nucleotidyltransferase with HDIG domain